MASLLCIVGFLLLALICPDSQASVFFRKTQDFCADFFNVMRYLCDRDPYFNSVGEPCEKIYLPLSYFILYPFTFFCDYTTMSLMDCWHSHTALLQCGVYTLIAGVIFIHSLLTVCKSYGYKRAFLILALLSSIFLFSVERGNLIFLSVAGINYFISFYHSENKKARYFALTCLCVASVLKIFPVFLGFLLLAERRYKDIAYCIVVSLLLTFLPFRFFTHGWENVPRLIENDLANNEVYNLHSLFPRFGIGNLVSIGTRYMLHIPMDKVEIWMTIARIFTIVCTILSVFLALREKRMWIQVALLTTIVIQLPICNSIYLGLYFFPVMILFFTRKEQGRYDWIYIIFFCLFICPLQIPFPHGTLGDMSITSFFPNIAITIMWVVTLWDSIQTVFFTPKSQKA